MHNASRRIAQTSQAYPSFDPSNARQLAVTKVSPPGERCTSTGDRDRDVPYYRAGLHRDGNTVRGHNMTPLFQVPELTLGLGSLTAFVFVSLSDQTLAGCGQAALVPGSRRVIETFFGWQLSVNVPIGPEGPGWPRLNHDVPNRCGMLYTPVAVREGLSDDRCARLPDGKRWPRPIYAMLNVDDECEGMADVVAGERAKEAA